MKKIILGFFLTVFTTVFTNAQEDFRLGALFSYGSEIESFGIGVTAEIPIIEKFTVAPSFVYFIPKDVIYVKTSIFEVNGNVNYYFMEMDSFSFYGLGGINYTSVKVEADYLGLGNYSSSEGNIGFNIGGGAQFDFGKKIMPFAEIKYVISEFDQLVISAGVKFNI